MNKQVIKIIEIAKALKPANVTGRNFHVSAIFNKNQLLSLGHNNYLKGHPSKRLKFKYKNYKGNNENYVPSLHGEVDSILNLGEKDCSRLTIVNVRIDNNELAANARPCPNCLSLLRMLNFKSIIYTKNSTEIEEIT